MALIGLSLAIGCATPEERYRTLSIFFDDVPLPESMRPEPVVEEVAALEDETVVPAVDKSPTSGWVVHKPECKECHPSRETKLPYAPPPDLCWDCHPAKDFANRFLHGPFAAGACLRCHTPHKSQHASLLRSSVEEVCEGCHDASTFGEFEQHREEKGEDCTRCHSPHSAATSNMLKPDAPTAEAPESAPADGVEAARP